MFGVFGALRRLGAARLVSDAWRSVGLGFALAAIAGTGVLSATDARGDALADAAVRIEYGFYAEEREVVAAAAAELRHDADADAASAYLLGLAALRLAQLEHEKRGGEAGKRLEECTEAAEEAAAGDRVAEALVLGAACETLLARREPFKSLLHQRRREQALRRAREIDPDNPRALLVEAWGLSAEPALEAAEPRGHLEAALAAAVEAFERRGGDPAGAEWGYAEALAQLAELRLLDGDILAARDLVERALILAPGYRFASRLEARLSAGH